MGLWDGPEVRFHKVPPISARIPQGFHKAPQGSTKHSMVWFWREAMCSRSSKLRAQKIALPMGGTRSKTEINAFGARQRNSGPIGVKQSGPIRATVQSGPERGPTVQSHQRGPPTLQSGPDGAIGPRPGPREPRKPSSWKLSVKLWEPLLRAAPWLLQNLVIRNLVERFSNLTP